MLVTYEIEGKKLYISIQYVMFQIKFQIVLLRKTLMLRLLLWKKITTVLDTRINILVHLY